MKTIIVTLMLAFIVSASFAQVNPDTGKAKKPVQAPVTKQVNQSKDKTFSIKGLNDQQIQSLFQIMDIAKQAIPYDRKLNDSQKIQYQTAIDDFSTFLLPRIVQDSISKAQAPTKTPEKKKAAKTP